jgi:hypothetical protein
MRARRVKVAALALATWFAARPAAGDPPADPSPPSDPVPQAPASPRRSGAGWLLIGASAGATNAVSSSGTGGSLVLGFWSHGVGNFEAMSAEWSAALAGGGGSPEFQGTLEGRLLFGWRGYVTDWQGPFVRLGIEAQQYASPLSLVSAPAGVIGYELADDRLAFDIGLHGAFAADASYQIYSGTPRDVSDSPLAGAYAWLVAPPVEATLRWDRLLPHDVRPLGTDPLDEIRVSSCDQVKGRLMICANLDLLYGPAALPSRTNLFGTTAVIESISLGIGRDWVRAQAP